MAGRKVRAPEKTLAVVDHNVPTTDRSKGIDDPEVRAPDRDARRERQGFRHRILSRARPPPGHRACGRARAGLHPARHDHRLRRQPYLDAWRLRRAGARHRHVRGRACARHPDADPAARPRTCWSRVDGTLPEGVTAKDIILAIIGEIGTAGGTGHVIEYARRGDRGALDGRAHDHLQHVDRRRRPRRPDRARRQDLRLYQGPPARAERRRLRDGQASLGAALFRRGRAFRPRSSG